MQVCYLIPAKLRIAARNRYEGDNRSVHGIIPKESLPRGIIPDFLSLSGRSDKCGVLHGYKQFVGPQPSCHRYVGSG